MAGWFARLMQRDHARSRPAGAAAALAEDADVERNLEARDSRYDDLVRMLRDRETEDRAAREKRQRGYRQSLASDAASGASAPSASTPIRLNRIPTKVPCRATPQARALLDELRRKFPGGTVTFAQVTARRRAVMLTEVVGAQPRQIGWIEQCVQSDPARCNVRHQGLVLETDGGSMLVMRFLYPPTPVRMSSRRDPRGETIPRRSAIDGWSSSSRHMDERELSCGTLDDPTSVDFAEIRPALDLRPSDRSAPPRLVWVTRPELATMNALRSRDYEAFYVRFKLEVLAGVWSALSALLSSASDTRWHRGSYYTVVRELDSTNGKICQRTVDDSGRAVDIGADRIYDAAPATDILLLYLEGDLLADFADIYFTLRSADAYFLKEEFFMVIRRFWAGAQSLALRYGSDAAAVIRMSQRAVPLPAQASMLTQDWTNLRQSLVDRYGAGGRKAADLVGVGVHRPRSGPLAWPFASFPAGEVNVGLRLIYRQEWRHLGVQRGDVVRTVPPGRTTTERETADLTLPTAPEELRRVDTTIEQRDTTRHLGEVVHEAADATAQAMSWPVDCDGSVNMGVRPLAATTDMGLSSECRESSRDTSTRLSDIMLKMAGRKNVETVDVARIEKDDDSESSPSGDCESPTEQDTATYVYSRLQNRYEVLTRPAEMQNVVLVAEKLPSPAEIDLSWVRRHSWILGKVLLDESFRGALDTIGVDQRAAQLIDTARDRLYEHLRANILHYQRAIWQREDPQQRSMRYRKSGRKVPLEWRFELESGAALTIDALAKRLAATHVDGQFATYSGGREAELDQVVDAARPLGYYGNYAVYQMRPELGSDELFSMLHFFKSPYLRPNPDTGAPEIDDPVLIDATEDPALYRRERTRRIAVDTDALVVDVIRSAERSDRRTARSDEAIHLVGAPDGYQMLLASGRGVELLSAHASRTTEGRWMILRGVGERMANLLAGASPGRSVTHGAHSDEVIRMRDDRDRMPTLLAGRAHDAEAGQVIVAREEGARWLTAVAGAGASQGDGRAILSRDPAPGMLDLRAGRAQDTESDGVILARDGRGLRLNTVAGAGTANPHERVILASGNEWLRPSLVAR